MMRIGLFLLTNLAVLVVAGIILSLLGVGSYHGAGGLNLGNLMVFCLVFGMAGSFVSLFLSKWMALKTTGTELIDPNAPRNQAEVWLLQEVAQLSQRAGIKMPDVGIFPSYQSNAFATGWNKNDALVSVSTGLLERMNQDELRAVLAHEIGHVANGDMVTLSLIQGVVNAFVMFFARVVGDFIDRNVFGREDGEAPGLAYFAITMVLDIVFGILASAIVMWFSRHREYRADEAGAQLAGKDAMISALLRLQAESERPDQMPKEMKAFAIAEGKEQGFSLAALFHTHPSIEQRVAALRQLNLP
ncbi:protease HtpX [Acinetobacter rongchengensis]|uniref:Protease HtpX n=1 Tax=Acinetobacter rongchengensis TaxID=2419601 RepID=A0A3A8F260_9GAMM|nr:protease HtpX [Acinetobacter rongchengensis]RKG34773.1 protease HtpX [Acinetobacter rongchengensis]